MKWNGSESQQFIEFKPKIESRQNFEIGYQRLLYLKRKWKKIIKGLAMEKSWQFLNFSFWRCCILHSANISSKVLPPFLSQQLRSSMLSNFIKTPHLIYLKQRFAGKFTYQHVKFANIKFE